MTTKYSQVKNSGALRRYKRIHNDHVAICSPYARSIKLAKEVSLADETGWETFDERALKRYFANGLQLVRRRLRDIEDLSVPLHSTDERMLTSMMESLIQARYLLEEIAQ